ncbi:45325_t:CDS:1, partial [Gigaspora margarita]
MQIIKPKELFESFFIRRGYDFDSKLDSWDYIERPMTTYITTYKIIQFLQNHGSFVRSNIDENNETRQYLFGTLIRNLDEIGDISFIGSVMKPGEEIKIHDCTYLTSKNNKDPELPNYNHIMFIAGDNGSTKDAEDY